MMQPWKKILIGIIVMLPIGLKVHAQGVLDLGPYHQVNPPFVVNIVSGGKLAHAQVIVELKAASVSDLSNLMYHNPAIQDIIIMRLSKAESDDLRTGEGKRTMAQQMTKELQKMLKREVGRPIVEQVLFTKFIIQ